MKETVVKFWSRGRIKFEYSNLNSKLKVLWARMHENQCAWKMHESTCTYVRSVIFVRVPLSVRTYMISGFPAWFHIFQPLPVASYLSLDFILLLLSARKQIFHLWCNRTWWTGFFFRIIFRTVKYFWYDFDKDKDIHFFSSFKKKILLDIFRYYLFPLNLILSPKHSKTSNVCGKKILRVWLCCVQMCK